MADSVVQGLCQDFRFQWCAIVTRVALDFGLLTLLVAIFRQQSPVCGRWMTSPVVILSSKNLPLG